MCHRPQWRRPYRSTLNPLKARSYSTPGLATTSRSASLGRQARGWCRLHHGRFALNWSRGQNHSALKSLGVLMASMDRKSNLRRDDPSSCLMSDGWPMSALAGFADSGRTSRQVREVSLGDICGAATAMLFDHLIGAGKHRQSFFRMISRKPKTKAFCEVI
jgi:hypothetical protein